MHLNILRLALYGLEWTNTIRKWIEHGQFKHKTETRTRSTQRTRTHCGLRIVKLCNLQLYGLLCAAQQEQKSLRSKQNKKNSNNRRRLRCFVFWWAGAPTKNNSQIELKRIQLNAARRFSATTKYFLIMNGMAYARRRCLVSSFSIKIVGGDHLLHKLWCVNLTRSSRCLLENQATKFTRINNTDDGGAEPATCKNKNAHARTRLHHSLLCYCFTRHDSPYMCEVPACCLVAVPLSWRERALEQPKIIHSNRFPFTLNRYTVVPAH